MSKQDIGGVKHRGVTKYVAALYNRGYGVTQIGMIVGLTYFTVNNHIYRAEGMNLLKQPTRFNPLSLEEVSNIMVEVEQAKTQDNPAGFSSQVYEIRKAMSGLPTFLPNKKKVKATVKKIKAGKA